MIILTYSDYIYLLKNLIELSDKNEFAQIEAFFPAVRGNNSNKTHNQILKCANDLLEDVVPESRIFHIFKLVFPSVLSWR